METDDDYDVAVDYLDRAKLAAYTEKMGLLSHAKKAAKLAKGAAAFAAAHQDDIARGADMLSGVVQTVAPGSAQAVAAAKLAKNVKKGVKTVSGLAEKM